MAEEGIVVRRISVRRGGQLALTVNLALPTSNAMGWLAHTSCRRKPFYANGGRGAAYSSGAVPCSDCSRRSRLAWLITWVRQPV